MTTLSPAVFQTLLAIGWVDGDLGREEADAVLKLAEDAGLADAELTELGAMAAAPVSFTTLDGDLDRDQRLFVYAVSSWIAQADDQVTEGERAALHAVATLLGITGTGRTWVDELVESWRRSEDRPGRLALSALRARIETALQEREGSS